MDLLRYKYYAGTTTYTPIYPATSLTSNNTNKLCYVTDTAGVTPSDSTDIEPQTLNNYAYDKIGNLIYDSKEHIDTIAWSVYGKIKRIVRSSGNTSYDMEFAYDPAGNRIKKTDKPKNHSTGALLNQSNWVTTYYVRDAQGNVMATYDETFTLLSDTTYRDLFTLREQDIYGSSRLGVRNGDPTLDTTSRRFTSSSFVNNRFSGIVYRPITYTAYVSTAERFSRTMGMKQYELTNHLGNVLATISDRKTAVNVSGILTDHYTTNVLNSQDYYSFGDAHAWTYFQPWWLSLRLQWTREG